jgi:hypothetical protein
MIRTAKLTVRLPRPGCQRFRAHALVLAFARAAFACRTSLAQESTDTVAQAARRIDARFAEVSSGDGDGDGPTASQVSGPGAAATIDAFAHDVEVLRVKTIMIFGERKNRWGAAYARFTSALADWARARGVADTNGARSALEQMRRAWPDIKAQYPPEALHSLPPLWSCPMHPEVMLARPESCPVCGMGLDPIYETQPELSREPVIAAQIVAPHPLEVDKNADLVLRLSFMDGKPVRLDDLEEAHTRKIHLLIIDLGQIDYHHVHPEPAADGEYTFSFTPRRPGPYRLWADLKPARTHVQQFSVVDIPARIVNAEPAGDEPENRTAEVDGYRFRLSFEKPEIRAVDTVRGRLSVTGPDGAPFTKLQVVMGAFGHFVGFRGHSTVLHIHPVGRALEPPDALSGPDLDFYFRSDEPGLIRLFTQVKAGDRELFPRFVVKVAPRPSPFGEESEARATGTTPPL